MFPSLIKAFPFIVDGIGSVISVGVGTAATTSVTDSTNNSSSSSSSSSLDNVPNTRDGLRRRNGGSIQLTSLTGERVRDIKNSAMIQDRIESKNRMEDLSPD